MYKFKLDTGSNGNLIPIRMYEKTFYTNILLMNYANPYNTQIVLCTINNSCIPEIGICQIAIIDKGINYRCIVFVVLANGPALLGMQVYKWLKLPTANCQTTVNPHMN